jgi:predicted RNA-binding protein with PUA-like domain
MTAAERKFWLLKTEPDSFSWDDLWKSRRRTAGWSGVRNYQARNFLRDSMSPGDGVLLYHSGADPSAVVGEARVASKAKPDPTQFDPKDDHHDPGSDPANPRWWLVDVQAVRPFPSPVTIDTLRKTRGIEKMVLLQRGSRLSVQPVTEKEWEIVMKLGMGGR